MIPHIFIAASIFFATILRRLPVIGAALLLSSAALAHGNPPPSVIFLGAAPYTAASVFLATIHGIAPSSGPAPTTNGIYPKIVQYTCSPTYYVASSGGSDSNTSTQAQSISTPWATIGHALSTAFAPGACISVVAGTYNVSINLENSGGTAGNANTTSGYAVLKCNTPAAPYTGTMPSCKLIGPNGSGCVVCFKAPYTIIDGFEVTVVTQSPANPAADNGINSSTAAEHHLGVYNSYFHDMGGGGIGMNAGEYFYLQGNVVSGTSFNSPYWDSAISIFQMVATGSESGALDIIGTYNGAGSSVHFHNVVTNNICHNNVESSSAVFGPGGTAAPATDGECIIMDCNNNPTSCSNSNPQYDFATLVYGNIGYANGGKGIEVGRSNNILLANNTLYNNNLGPYNTGVTGNIDHAELWITCGSNNTWINNIGVAVPGTSSPTSGNFAAGSTGGCSGAGGIGYTLHNTWTSNIFDNFGSNTSTNGYVLVNYPGTDNSDVIAHPPNLTIPTNPLWTSPGSANFTLQSGSPASGTAASLSSIFSGFSAAVTANNIGAL